MSPENLNGALELSKNKTSDSDAAIAQLMQYEYDEEHDALVLTVENKLNEDLKISTSCNNCRHIPDNYDSDSPDDYVEMTDQEYWDDFKENKRTRRSKSNKLLDKGKHLHLTTQLGVDDATSLTLYKLMKQGILKKINGVIAAGENSVIFHAWGNTNFKDLNVPKECAIKVYKTTLGKFQPRGQYIEADYHYKDRLSKHNQWKIINMRAELEMRHLMRMHKVAINSPRVICLKNHILVMSFIGNDNKPAPKLKQLTLKLEEWQSIYEEIVVALGRMYNFDLVYAGMSEQNILWWDNKCWFTDLSRPVYFRKPNLLRVLLKNCHNICNFFKKKGLQNIMSPEELLTKISNNSKINANTFKVHAKCSTLHYLGNQYDQSYTKMWLLQKQVAHYHPNEASQVPPYDKDYLWLHNVSEKVKEDLKKAILIEERKVVKALAQQAIEKSSKKKAK